jgi:hypothetical protein
VAKVILDEFATRFAAGMSSSSRGHSSDEANASRPAQTLSGPALMIRVARTMLAQAFARLRAMISSR